MHIVCVGLSHRTAPVELRERVALGSDEVAAALRELRSRYGATELALLSTCNRTELYMARPLHGHPRVSEAIAWLAERSGLDDAALAPVTYHHDNEKAVRHLMRVASGLDSMVVGETQVLGQIKRAYELAQEAEAIGAVLHEVFRAALSTAKRVRRETGIDTGRTSVASVAVDFARHLFHEFADKTIAAIGVNEMTKLALRQFAALSPRRIVVCNRTASAGEALAARFGGEAVGLDRLDELLIEADVVISSTGAAAPIVTAERFRGLLRRRRFRPIFVIDIAVPRDFEPAVGDLANVYLYDMDDLQRAIADQMAARNGQVSACDALIEQAVAACYTAIQTEDYAELIRTLRQRLHEFGELEQQRTLGKLRQAADETARQRVLTEHTHRLVQKILHRPLSALGRGDAVEAAMYATALRRLFELDGAEDFEPPETTRPRNPPHSPGDESS